MYLLQEAFDLVRVTRDCHSGLYSIQLPSQKELQSRWTELKVRAPVPECHDVFHVELWNLVKAKLPILQAIAAELSQFGKLPSARVELPTPPSTASSRQEDIRRMSPMEVIARCAELGIEVEPHPTNPGISSMRRRNALYSHARRTGDGEDPPPAECS